MIKQMIATVFDRGNTAGMIDREFILQPFSTEDSCSTLGRGG